MSGACARRYLLRVARAGVTLFLVAALSCWDAANAQEIPPPWPVTGKLLGRQKEKATNISGIACASASGFPRKCLVVDDETQGAQIAIVKDGEILAGDFIRLITDRFKNKKLELDAEGVAFADGHFYVIGSHGRPRDRNMGEAKVAARIAANSHVFRLRIDPAAISGGGELAAAAQIKDSTALTGLIAAEPRLAQFAGRFLDENGLTIEGVAVSNGRLYSGLRGPLLDGNRAAVFSVSLSALFDGAAPDPDLKLMDLGAGRGVRDLVAYDGNFLVLAGPTADGGGQYSIYRWDGGSGVKHLRDLPRFANDIKPEAMLPLDQTATELRVLILFDGPKEGEPRAFTMPYP